MKPFWNETAKTVLWMIGIGVGTLLFSWGATTAIEWTPALKAAAMASGGFLLGQLRQRPQSTQADPPQTIQIPPKP